MTDRFVDLEERVERLEGAVRGLEQRLASLDSEPPPADASLPPLLQAGRAAGALSGAVALTGRACLVLGGAFLIRAAAEADSALRTAGAAAGLAYAGIWLFASDRDGTRGRVLSAAFHAVTAAGIAYPLLWEACTRFGLLSPLGAVGAVAAATAVLLALSVRQSTGALAWAATVGAISTLLALVASTGALGPAAGAAILLAGATIAVAERRGWRGPRWVAGIVADLAVLASAAAAGKSVSFGAAVALALALPAVCVAGLALPIVLRRRSIEPFDIVQIGASLLLGFGAAISAARSAGSGVALLGAAAVAVGLAAYGAALRSCRREGDPGNFHFSASLALAMLITGGAFWLSAAALSFFWSALAVGVSLFPPSFPRGVVRWHCAAYVVAAAAASGFFGFVAGAFAGPASAGKPTPPVPGVLAAAAAAYGILSLRPGHAAFSTRLPALLIGAAALAGIGALAIRLLASSSSLGGGRLAALRTGVLAAAALAAAFFGRSPRTRELGWLVSPLLVLGGLKLLLEDVPNGTPLTLFVGFALFGAALLLAPRIARSSRVAQDAAS